MNNFSKILLQVIIYLIYLTLLFYFTLDKDASFLKDIAIIFGLISFLSWFDFGFFRVKYFKFLSLQEEINTNVLNKILLINLILMAIISILRINFINPNIITAIITSFYISGLKNYYDIKGESSIFVIIINLFTVVGLFFDFYYNNQIFNFLIFRFLGAILLHIYYEFSLHSIVFNKIKGVENLNWLTILKIQLFQIVPYYIDRIFLVTIGNSEINSKSFIIVEVISKITPLIGSIINNFFIDHSLYNINNKKIHNILIYNITLIILGIIFLNINTYNALFFSIIYVFLCVPSLVVLYLVSLHSELCKLLIYIYLFESVVCLFYLITLADNLYHVLIFRYMVDILSYTFLFFIYKYNKRL